MPFQVQNSPTFSGAVCFVFLGHTAVPIINDVTIKMDTPLLPPAPVECIFWDFLCSPPSSSFCFFQNVTWKKVDYFCVIEILFVKSEEGTKIVLVIPLKKGVRELLTSNSIKNIYDHFCSPPLPPPWYTVRFSFFAKT